MLQFLAERAVAQQLCRAAMARAPEGSILGGWRSESEPTGLRLASPTLSPRAAAAGWSKAVRDTAEGDMIARAADEIAANGPHS